MRQLQANEKTKENAAAKWLNFGCKNGINTNQTELTEWESVTLHIDSFLNNK